jgi:PleD family two-component response regulator
VARHDWHPLKPGTEVTISIGLCAAGPYDLAILQARADHALYGAKARGRNQLCVAGAQER